MKVQTLLGYERNCVNRGLVVEGASTIMSKKLQNIEAPLYIRLCVILVLGEYVCTEDDSLVSNSMVLTVTQS